MRRLLLALPLLLAVSACDSTSGGNNNNPVTAVRFTGASLIDLDFTRPDGSAWDPTLSGGPDVYLRLLVNDVEVRNTQDDNDLDNLSETDLPRTLTFGSAVQVSNLSHSVVVEVWDDDGDTDELIATLPAVSAQTLANNAPVTYNMTDGETLVRFTMAYTR